MTPRNVYSLIYITDELMTDDEIFENNPVRVFLKPKLEKYYKKRRNEMAKEKLENDKQ